MKSILGRHSQKVRRREKGRKYDDLLKGGENVGSMVGQKKEKEKSFRKSANLYHTEGN